MSDKKDMSDMTASEISYRKFLKNLGVTTHKEIEKLNEELDSFKKIIVDNNNLYESMLDKTTKSLEKIINNTESLSKIQ